MAAIRVWTDITIRGTGVAVRTGSSIKSGVARLAGATIYTLLATVLAVYAFTRGKIEGFQALVTVGRGLAFLAVRSTNSFISITSIDNSPCST